MPVSDNPPLAADPSATQFQSDEYSSKPPSKPELRQLLRARRRALTCSQQATAAASLSLRLMRSHWFRASQNIAFYLANDGEMDTVLLMEMAQARGKHCFLPLIDKGPHPSMLFARYRRGDRLAENRFGIDEPLPNAEIIEPARLDLVLVPLVGFDITGGRLGMGAGYYDRSFSAKLQRPKASPRLIGLAHQCQCVRLLPGNDWDVPLDGVVTDTATYRFR
jgi:5-formyltetrahydrofolate cyclo-ligase